MTSRPKTPIRTDEVLMTVAQVAALNQTSERTVLRAIKAGRLEAVRIGPARRLIRITPEAHAAYRQRLRPRL